MSKIPDFVTKLPTPLRRKILSELAEHLKALLRTSVESNTLQEGEEDFGLLLFQLDKRDPQSALLARVAALNTKGDVVRLLDVYNVDNLIGEILLSKPKKQLGNGD